MKNKKSSKFRKNIKDKRISERIRRMTQYQKNIRRSEENQKNIQISEAFLFFQKIWPP
jgi:hypothetical protein